MRALLLSGALLGVLALTGCDKNGAAPEPEAPAAEPTGAEAPATEPGESPGVGEPGDQPVGAPGERPGEPTPGEGGELVVGDDPCEQDADCRPADCCHPAACVGAENAPDCGDTMCTEECRPGTLDCGGKCVCHEGRCAARLNDLGSGAPVQ